MYHSFENLDVWKRSRALAVRLYRQLRECHDYGFRDQMQRAAISIPSNIAEGSERSRKDFRRFLLIALGSAAELRTQISIASEVGIIPDDVCEEMTDELQQLSKMLRRLSETLKTEN